jgi:AcrR family transcriptional regulator
VRGPELAQQILDRAFMLLYAEGINSTGVDRIAENAGVTKRTLYRHFPTKEALVRAALDHGSAPAAARLLAAADRAVADGLAPSEELLMVFRELAALTGRPGFRGCPFLNAAAELPDPEHPAIPVVRAHKDLIRRRFRDAADRGGARDPGSVARQLVQVLDGALMHASLVPPEDAAAVCCAALETARAVVDAAGLQ